MKLVTRTYAGLIALCVALTGCDENARRMAKEASEILHTYEKQLDAKLHAELTAYQKQAQIEAEASRRQAFENLEQERVERSRSIAADLVEKQMRASKWRQALRDYAIVDFSVQREFLLGNLNSESRYLERILELQLDKQKVAALTKAFEALTQETKLTGQAKDLATFGSDAKNQFDKNVCAGLKSELDVQNKALAAAATDADKDKANTAIEALTQARSDKGCNAIEAPKT
jgi:hypothetical protein